MPEGFIPKHGGYRKLKSFQVAQLAFDVTVRFVEKYIDRFSRTRDQMTQAARSGVQNIAEASQASGTSKETEIKLTNVARASLEELRLDYEDYLRQNELPMLKPDDPALKRFKARRPETLGEFREWVADERKRIKDFQGRAGTSNPDEPLMVGGSPCLSSAALAANGVLSLLNLACWLLSRQLQTLEQEFLAEGGLRERMTRARIEAREEQRRRK
jgi:four helix bundle suffix protein